MFSIKQLQSKLVPPIQSLAAVSSSTSHSETRGPHLPYTENNLWHLSREHINFCTLTVLLVTAKQTHAATKCGVRRTESKHEAHTEACQFTWDVDCHHNIGIMKEERMKD